MSPYCCNTCCCYCCCPSKDWEIRRCIFASPRSCAGMDGSCTSDTAYVFNSKLPPALLRITSPRQPTSTVIKEHARAGLLLSGKLLNHHNWKPLLASVSGICIIVPRMYLWFAYVACWWHSWDGSVDMAALRYSMNDSNIKTWVVILRLSLSLQHGHVQVSMLTSTIPRSPLSHKSIAQYRLPHNVLCTNVARNMVR